MAPWLLPLWACSGGDSAPDDRAQTADTGTPECSDTWESFGRDFLRTWCTSCHSSQLGPGHRYGAPLGIDFDTYAASLALAPLLLSSATGDDPTMPPVGGPRPEDRERLARWVACGLPGEGPTTTEPLACADPVEASGSVTISTPDQAAALCASAVSIEGDLEVLASGDLSCVCAVGGDLTLGPGASTVDLSGLTSVGGDLTASGAPLGEVSLPALVDVGGALVLSDLPEVERVDLTRLQAVGGELRLQDLPKFALLVGEGYAVERIGGDLILDDLDAWYGSYAFLSLHTLGGGIVVRDNDRLSQINGFRSLPSVASIVIEDNPTLRSVHGFDAVSTVTGDLILRRNPALEAESAFAALQTVGGAVVLEDDDALEDLGGVAAARSFGSLTISGCGELRTLEGWRLASVTGDLVIRENPSLLLVDDFPDLATVGGDLVFESNPQLVGLGRLPQLAAIGGSLLVVDNDQLARIPGFEPLRTIGRDLVLSDNDALADVLPLHTIDEVTGDVLVTDNASLTTDAASAMVQGIDVGGQVIISGNAP